MYNAYNVESGGFGQQEKDLKTSLKINFSGASFSNSVSIHRSVYEAENVKTLKPLLEECMQIS